LILLDRQTDRHSFGLTVPHENQTSRSTNSIPDYIFLLLLATNISHKLDVCLTVHHQYNDVNNQQDATTF